MRGAEKSLKLRDDDACLAKFQGGDGGGGGEGGEERSWHLTEVGLAGAGENFKNPKISLVLALSITVGGSFFFGSSTT